MNVGYSVQNASEKPLKLDLRSAEQHAALPTSRDTQTGGLSTMHALSVGAAFSTADSKYEKYKFDTILDNENLNVSTKNGWVAMLQQYFTTAWVPRNNGTNNFYTANLGNGVVAIGYKSQPVLVQARQTDKLQSTLWVGPAIQGQNGCRCAAPGSGPSTTAGCGSSPNRCSSC